MADRRIGVIINGATGRMGTTQHMAHLLAIAAVPAGRAACGGLRASSAYAVVQMTSATETPRKTEGQPNALAATGPPNTASD